MKLCVPMSRFQICTPGFSLLYLLMPSQTWKARYRGFKMYLGSSYHFFFKQSAALLLVGDIRVYTQLCSHGSRVPCYLSWASSPKQYPHKGLSASCLSGHSPGPPLSPPFSV